MGAAPPLPWLWESPALSSSTDRPMGGTETPATSTGVILEAELPPPGRAEGAVYQTRQSAACERPSARTPSQALQLPWEVPSVSHTRVLHLGQVVMQQQGTNTQV